MFILRSFVILKTRNQNPLWHPCGDIFYVRSLKKFLLRFLRYNKLQFLIRKKNILFFSSIFTCPFIFCLYKQIFCLICKLFMKFMIVDNIEHYSYEKYFNFSFYFCKYLIMFFNNILLT